MNNTKKILLIVGIVLLAACIALLVGLLLPSCGGPDADDQILTGDMTYTVQVKNASDLPLPDVGIYIYEDETMAELVWYDTTDAEGKMSFTNAASNSYVAVLSDVPAGYGVEDYYPLTGELTQIVLSAGTLSAEDMENTTYKLGDMMADFTVTTPDGTEYTLSELLKTKRAVVLNFWYIECQPCNLEFPFMQEAYEEYKDLIEILALNPVNQDDAAIAAFQKELGLTFPMAKVDPAWEKLMGLTAYPTTVVIDRYGNISLIHRGMVDDTDTFLQLFAYFTADDYEPKAIESIDEIVTKAEGSEENPKQQGGDRSFEVTVGPGETYFMELYKITGQVYLTVSGEDFILTYNGKEYTPKNGSVTITITSEGPSTPVKLQLKNTSDKEQTYEVSMAAPKGSYGNPYSLSLGEFSISTKAGDEQGTYGTYVAEKNGTLTARCLKSNVSKYGFFLYNLRSYAMRNADEDSIVDEDGYVTVSVQVKKGDKIQFNVAVARDSNNYIAAGSFKFDLKLEEGDGEDEKKAEAPKTVYEVTVTDEAGKPVSGVVVNLEGEFTYEPTEEEKEQKLEPQNVKVNLNLTTDATGKVSSEQINGPYTATVRIPDGYTLGTTRYELTAEKPSVTVKLKKIVYKDYSVTIKTPDGKPVSGVIVIVGSGVSITDAKGVASFNLVEGSYSALLIGVPDDYILTESVYTLTNKKPNIVVELGYGSGHETNPIILRDQITAKTSELEPGELEYYTVYGAGGSILIIEDADAFVKINGGEPIYAGGAASRIYYPLEESDEPITLAVGNNGAVAESYTINFQFPEGTWQNPQVISSISRPSITVDAGDEDGKYLAWTSPKSGEVTLSFRSGSTENCIVTVGTGEDAVKMIYAENGTATVRFERNVPLILHVIAAPEEDGSYLSAKANLTGKISYDPEPVGTNYSVTVTDKDGAPQSGILVQFAQNGTPVGDPVATNSSGVAEMVIDTAECTVSFVDETILYDAALAKLTESAPAVTIPIAFGEQPVEEGKTRYSVTVTDFDGNMIGDVVVLFMKNGTPAGYSIVGASGGAVSADLTSGTYQIQLAFLKDAGYHYEETTAVVKASAPNLKIQVAKASDTKEEENWNLGLVKPVAVGGTYVKLQSDIVNYFSFKPTEQGVYRFTTSDPKAVISYWGEVNYPADMTSEVEDYANNAFTRSINTNALGQNHVIGVTGAPDCILIITRVGDAVEDIPYETYVPKTSPEEMYPDVLKDPDDPESEVLTKKTFKLKAGETLTKVDITAKTSAYKLVMGSDGYYHLGSANGPVMYVQLTFNKVNPDNPIEPSYVHLYKMVGGVDNTGTALRCIMKDAEGNELGREDYTTAMLEYGDNADPTYGVYPLTEDLKYMLQMGGGYQGWWDAENVKGNLLFVDEDGNLDTSINLEIAWMFACYYGSSSSARMLSLDDLEDYPAQETEPTEETQPETVPDAEEILPPQEEETVPPVTEEPATEPTETPTEEPVTEPEETPAEEPATEPEEIPTEEPTDPTDEMLEETTAPTETIVEEMTAPQE